MKHKTLLLCGLYLGIYHATIMSCTGIRLTTTQGAVIYARTLEFGAEVESEALYIPRNHLFHGTAPNGKPEGLVWTSKYAALGINAVNLIGFLDGINEKGLAGGLFYFPGYAQYQNVSEDQIKKSIASWEILTWILTQFASVQEVKKHIPALYVSQAKFPQWGKVQPIHLVIHDSFGTSLVIEYVQGKLYLYDNELGVLTNSPTFDWHMTNLKNYIKIDAKNVKPKKLGNILLTPFGQGSGMLGLPGDFTPPSRFVRAIEYSQNIAPAVIEIDGIFNAFHILNSFDIPIGVIKEGASSDYTQWTSACDLKNKRYYFHTYDNRQIRMLDLRHLITTTDQVTTWPMKTKSAIINIAE